MRAFLASTVLWLTACEPSVAPSADAPVGPDAGIDGDFSHCSFSTSHFAELARIGGPASLQVNGAGAADDIIVANANLDLDDPADMLAIELYGGAGVFAGGIAPGTYALTGPELDYAECGACVRLMTNFFSPNWEHDYFAIGGTVTLTEVPASVGQPFTIELTDLVLRHVDINFDTFVVTPIDDGCETRIDRLVVSTDVVAAP